ncbi:MAG: 7-carboxy-7-deazaguanine synthase QueE [Cytophagales bacterium]|nr:7-carboxy-7-deazaguanine synthase QueE [Cytophagales bacterium]
MEAFYTIQGEGFYQGHAAYFIRLGGCDVGCVWCDVKESWDADSHPLYTVEQIVRKASEEAAGKLVVLTGGEPLMYNCQPLTDALRKAGFQVNIETSGAHPLSGAFDWICLSPKKFKPAVPEIFGKANELKVVVYNKADFAWAEELAQKVDKDCRLYLQPEWSKSAKLMPLLVEYVKNNPKWRVCVQIHKYMDIP